MVFRPRSSAQPSSRSSVLGSKVSSCHISNWLTALLGMKLQPTSHGCFWYHALAASLDQRAGCCAPAWARPGSNISRLWMRHLTAHEDLRLRCMCLLLDLEESGEKILRLHHLH